jgi:hypothetical protein
MTTYTLKEEIFEADGIASEEEFVAPESFEDPNIEKIQMDVDSAVKLFGSRLLNAEHAG